MHLLPRATRWWKRSCAGAESRISRFWLPWLQITRHEFVPAELQTPPYDDVPLPIGDEQTISQPYIVAVMTVV